MVWTPINHGDTDLPNCLDCICMKSFTQRFQFFLAFFDTFEATRRHWMELPGASVFFSIRIFFFAQAEIMNAANNPEVGKHRWFWGCGTQMWLWGWYGDPQNPKTFVFALHPKLHTPFWFRIDSSSQLPKTFLKSDLPRSPPSKKANSFREFGRC